MSCQKPHEVQEGEVKSCALEEGNIPGTSVCWGLPSCRASVAVQWVRGADRSPQHLWHCPQHKGMAMSSSGLSKREYQCKRTQTYWRNSNECPSRLLMGWSASDMKTGWESWDHPAWRREGSEGSYQCRKISEWKVQREQRQALFSGGKTSGKGNNLKLRRFSLCISKMPYCEDDQAHAQVVQRICGVSVLGDMSVVQAWSWPTGSRCPCLSRSVEPVSEGLLEPWTFCDSVKFMYLKEPHS